VFSLWFFVLLVDVLDGAPGEQKTADLHQAAESSVEIFSFGRLLSRTSTLAGQGTLPPPTTGCRIRFIESLLMLRTSHKLAEAGCQTLNEKPTLFPSFRAQSSVSRHCASSQCRAFEDGQRRVSATTGATSWGRNRFRHKTSRRAAPDIWVLSSRRI
jgi:hypothetical protein